MTVFHQEAKKGQHRVKCLEHIRSHHPPKKVIHLMLDRASYHRAQPVVQAAERLNIRLHYLPPYSPNLNPIERLWKVMNQQVRRNRYFPSPPEFQQAIQGFFDDI